MGKPKIPFNNKSARKAQQRFYKQVHKKEQQLYEDRQYIRSLREMKRESFKYRLHEMFMRLLTTNNEGIITSEWFEN